MTIILDSNFLFALNFNKDKNFQRAYELFNELKENYRKPYLVSNSAVDETLTLTFARFNGSTYHLDKIFELL